MKRILVFLFISHGFFARSQDEFKYNAQIDLGVGATIFNIPNTLNISEKSGAFATAFKLDATFEVKKHFSIGLGITMNKYATEKDTNETFVEAKSPVILFLANYHLLDTKKMNFCIGTGIGVNGLNYTRKVLYDSIVNVGKVHTEGPAFLVNAQYRYYFTKTFGMYIRAQYVVNGGRLKSVTVNGDELERIDNHPIEEVFFNFRGVSVSLGLSLRF
jgi:hypothetical protein